jgi:hypothetical protein
VLPAANATVNGSGLRRTRRRTVGGAAPTFRHWRERSGLSAPATDPIPALTGTHDQLRQAERLRSGHIATLLDMDRNNTATDAVGSAVAKLLHIAMRQQQAGWWLRYAPGRQTGDLLAELAGRLAADGRMDAETLRMVVQEAHRLRYRVISGRTDLTLGL